MLDRKSTKKIKGKKARARKAKAKEEERMRSKMQSSMLMRNKKKVMNKKMQYTDVAGETRRSPDRDKGKEETKT